VRGIHSSHRTRRASGAVAALALVGLIVAPVAAATLASDWQRIEPPGSVAIFGLVSVALWSYFRFRPTRQSPAA
jgi:hypothetical protein